MSYQSGALDAVVLPTGWNGVYAIPADAVGGIEGLLENDAVRLTIDGRPITAVAPHPDVEDLLYVTTEHPATLSFLPDPYVEIEPATGVPRRATTAGLVPVPPKQGG